METHLVDERTAARRIVRLAVRALAAPIALFARVEGSSVNVVSSSGLSEEAAREIAASSASVEALSDVLLVADLTADRRPFAVALLRAVPSARAAALAPVLDDRGSREGIVAVLATEPRSWTDDDVEALRDLGSLGALASPPDRQEGSQLDGPEREAELRATNERLTRELDERCRAEELYRTITKNFPNGAVLLFDHDIRYTLADGLGLADVGLAGIRGKTMWDLFTRELTDLIEPLHRGALRGENHTIELPYAGRMFLLHVLPVKREDGSIMSGMVVAQDISPRVAAEEALRQAAEASEAANRAKSAFLANMSHEIRTPMSAILGYTQLLQRDPCLSPKQQQCLDVVSRSGEHLLNLINDVLEMSKIEAGFRKVVLGDIDLTALLDDLERLFRLRANGKRLSFEIFRSQRVPSYIVSDEGKLRQVLVNLLGNAVKFTEQGGVTVRLHLLAAAGDDPRLVAQIEDTGPGISAEEIMGLFQPFAQTRVGIQAHGGTGLGLALSREFARLLGGDITVESRIGKGSVFRLEIPVEISSAQASVRPAPRMGRVVGIRGNEMPVTILVVDDDKDNRSWLRQLLLQVGFDVREAVNGAEAVASFDQWRPRLVLMDMNMPVMDGYAATRVIKTRSEGPATVIIAVTASAFDDARDAIFEAGADGWLRKPCREADLLEEIRRHLKIEYLYADQLLRSPVTLEASPESQNGALGSLPPEFALRLREAARIADYERLTELISGLPMEYARIADELSRLVESYAYDKIEQALR